MLGVWHSISGWHIIGLLIKIISTGKLKGYGIILGNPMGVYLHQKAEKPRFKQKATGASPIFYLFYFTSYHFPLGIWPLFMNLYSHTSHYSSMLSFYAPHIASFLITVTPSLRLILQTLLFLNPFPS